MMERFRTAFFFLGLSAGMVLCPFGQTPQGLVDDFDIDPGPLTLSRGANPAAPFTKAGRRFSILGFEGGSFEAWAYPLKLVRNFEFSFLLGSSTRPLPGRDLVRRVEVNPEATILTFVHQGFTMRAIFIVPIDEAGALILLDLDSTEPVTVVSSFIPVLQPMWPAGIGGQYAHWNSDLSAYVISESSRKNHGLVGSPAAKGVSYTPAHMLGDTPNEFKIEVSDPESVKGRFIPIVLAGGKGRREDVLETYRRLAASPEGIYRKNLEYFGGFRQSTLRIETPDAELNLAFEWSKIALDSLFVNNPDLGFGMVAGLGASGTGGRPGFGWFFGGDSYINGLALLGFGHFDNCRRILEFFQKYQRQDGKMPHEISQSVGYVDWFKDYPYAYIHADTSPFYIVAAGEYLRRSGDVEFIKKSYPSIKRAFEWSSSMDGDGDGLMDNKLAGLGAVEYGELTDIQSDVYLSAVWVKACQAMQRLAAAAGDNGSANKARITGERGRQAFESRFWNAQTSTYVFGFDKEGRQVSEISPMCSIGLMWGLAEPQRSAQTLRRLHSADITADWGARILSTQSRHYEPLNYNYGAAWPFQAGWLAAAQFQHDFPLQGFLTLQSTARHTFDNELGAITELFSGDRNVWPAEGVSHQGFSSTGVAYPVVRGLLGLDSDVESRSVWVSPGFPPHWELVRIANYRVGQGHMDLVIRRTDGTISAEVNPTGLAGYSLVFAPKLEPGAKVKGCWIDGKAVESVRATDRGTSVVPEVVHRLGTGASRIELALEPSLQLLPPDRVSRTGDSDRGIKLINASRNGSVLAIEVEGLSGRDYVLPVRHPEKARSVRGAELKGASLLVRIPAGKPGQFVRHALEVDIN